MKRLLRTLLAVIVLLAAFLFLASMMLWAWDGFHRTTRILFHRSDGSPIIVELPMRHILFHLAWPLGIAFILWLLERPAGRPDRA